MDSKITEVNVEEQLNLTADKNSISSLTEFELMFVGGGSADVVFG